jgi:hypothetical protein
MLHCHCHSCVQLLLPHRYVSDMSPEEMPTSADMGEFLAARFMELIESGRQQRQQQKQQQGAAAAAAPPPAAAVAGPEAGQQQQQDKKDG